MEVMKNIFFDTDILIPFMKVKIFYTGKFFEDSSANVSLEYCFENDWEKAQSIGMEKTELGYQAEIELPDSKTFNFRFLNEAGEIDNNNETNYNFDIEETDFSLIVLNDELGLAKKKGLSRIYLWKKRAKITIYKAITFLPRLIAGKYKRKLTDNK